MYEQNLGELDGLKEYVEKRTKDKDEIIEDLRAENKRLNEVIINLHNELRQYDKKVKKQEMIINTMGYNRLSDGVERSD